LDSDWYIPLKLVERERLNHDSFRLRVQIDRETGKTFPVPSCLYIKDDAIQVMRPYTPINTNPYTDGYVDFIVKRYENGAVSRTLTGFNVGDYVHIRGPMVEYEYKRNSKNEIGMIAGGTGIAPMYQMIQRILEDPEDKTRLWLIYGNKKEEDILLRKELDSLREKHKDRFQVDYLLEYPSEEWTGGRGRVTSDLVKGKLGDNHKTDGIQRLVLVCGPDAMLHNICGDRALNNSQGPVRGMLGRLGLTSKEVWK
ncbi:uncharacterized protein BYT42DRAFT_470361, partial [Radiomyces spectabilis]|uniref:uncharacterized protein n=1 Tax=Radiomyces spectabilis TaxID=64574 RepID=UPI00222047F1